MGKEALSLRAYAKHRGVSLPAVQKAIRAGRIRTTPDGKINASEADQEWERNTDPRPGHRLRTSGARAARPKLDVTYGSPAPDPSPGGINYARERALRERIRVRRETIELRKLEERFVSRDEVKVATFNEFECCGTVRSIFPTVWLLNWLLRQTFAKCMRS